MPKTAASSNSDSIGGQVACGYQNIQQQSHHGRHSSRQQRVGNGMAEDAASPFLPVYC